MAARLGADSLRYLPVESVARSIGFEPSQLCQACLTGKYPTPAGERLYEIALTHTGRGDSDRGGSGRTYESASAR
jgi:amidophosphoribosyltransferase